MDRYLLEPDVNTLQPVLKEYNNLPCCASFKDDFPQSDHAMCDCASEILTPPLSPEQFPISPAATKTGLPEVKTFYNSFMTNPPNTFVEELLITNFSNDCPRVLPDLKDTCTELFSREPMHLSVPHRKIFNQSSSKDCMWNGRGFRPIVRNRSQSRSDSPGSPICSPVSGCVDPRSVFNQFGDRRKSLSPHRARIASGAETPSDSGKLLSFILLFYFLLSYKIIIYRSIRNFIFLMLKYHFPDRNGLFGILLLFYFCFYKINLVVK